MTILSVFLSILDHSGVGKSEIFFCFLSLSSIIISSIYWNRKILFLSVASFRYGYFSFLVLSSLLMSFLSVCLFSIHDRLAVCMVVFERRRGEEGVTIRRLDDKWREMTSRACQTTLLYFLFFFFSHKEPRNRRPEIREEVRRRIFIHPYPFFSCFFFSEQHHPQMRVSKR